MIAFKAVPLRRGFRRFLLGLTTLSLIGASGISSSRDQGSRVTLNGIPHIAQLPNFCGPAALSSLFSYWGKTVSQNAIGQKVYDKKYGATNGADLLYFAREEGFSAYTYLSSTDELKDHLRGGLPVLILQEMSPKDKRGHFRVVMGFSDHSESFILRDSNYEKPLYMDYEEFDDTWKSFGRWALVVCPKDRERSLNRQVKENPVLHLDLGQALLRRKMDRQALLHFEEALRLEPDNEEALDQLALLRGRDRRRS